MLHESIKQTQFVVKENESYRMRVTKHEVLAPKGVYAIDFIQESLMEDGTIRDSQTYNFFMTQDDLNVLCEGLLNG
jgi:hypothetical protein